MKATVLDDQLARLLARTVAAVPSERPLARGPLDPGVALVDGPALGLAVHQVVLLPPVAVTADVVALLGDGPGDCWVALQGDRTGEERTADRILREDAQEAPDTTRLPYSNIDSFARSRFSGGTGDMASPHDSRRPMPSCRRFSAPSS